MDFNDDFFGKIWKLMQQPRSNSDATAELRKMHDDVCAHYIKQGIGTEVEPVPVKSTKLNIAAHSTPGSRQHSRQSSPVIIHQVINTPILEKMAAANTSELVVPRKYEQRSSSDDASAFIVSGSSESGTKTKRNSESPDSRTKSSKKRKRVRLKSSSSDNNNSTDDELRIKPFNALFMNEPDDKPKLEPNSPTLSHTAVEPCSKCLQSTAQEGNMLVGCQDCGKMFHQKCHSPSIPDKEAQDPRLVWYCSNCSNKLKLGVVQLQNQLPSKPKSVPHGSSKSVTLIKPKPRDSLAPSIAPGGIPLASGAELNMLANKFLAKQKSTKPQNAFSGSQPAGSSGSERKSVIMSSAGAASMAGGSGLSKLATGFPKHLVGSTAVPKPVPDANKLSQAVNTSRSLMEAADKRIQMMKKKAALQKGTFFKR